jgi:N-acetylneuraminic acid mutarotase
MHKKKLYVFGGEPNQLLQLNDLYVYQIENNLWIELKPKGVPPTPRVSTSALIYDEVIYFFGGYDGET